MDRKYREEQGFYGKITDTRSTNCRRTRDRRNLAPVPCGKDSSTPQQQRKLVGHNFVDVTAFERSNCLMEAQR
jgi:hypothetical protein